MNSKNDKPDLLLTDNDGNDADTDNSDTKTFLNLKPLAKPTSDVFDDILADLCGRKGVFNPGWFAIRQFILYCSSVSAICHVAMNIVFIGYEPPHKCAVLHNDTLHSFFASNGMGDNDTASVVYQECSIELMSNASGTPTSVASLSCINGNDYGGDKHISFVSEWDLVCEDNTGLTAFVQTVLNIGQGFGAICMTSIADKFGRKPVVMVCLSALVAIGIGCTWCPNIYVLIVARFFIGFFQQGVGLVAFALAMEGFPPRYRRHVGVMAGVNWNVTVATFSLAAWLMKDSSWRDMQLLSGLVGLTVLLYPMFLEESPRWLIANKKYDKALQVLKRACKCNNKDFSVIKKIFNEKIVNNSIQGKDDDTAVTKYNLLDLLKNKTLRNNTFIICFSWITCSTTYYALVLSSSSFAGDRHLNFFLMGAVDFFGDIVILTMLDRVGRRGLAIIFLFFTGGAVLTASFLVAYAASPLTHTLTTVFFVIGKFGIGVCFSIMFIYTPELYPTNLRTVGFGFCSAVARIGGMIAPYSGALTKVVMWGPGAIFTVMCLLSGVLFFKLPETKGRSLPTTIEDMETWNAGNGGVNIEKGSVELKRRGNGIKT